jgi:hypothetical protein
MDVALFPSNSLGRNEPCHCGSGKKYKQCCLSKDEAAERAARAKASEKTEKAAEKDQPATEVATSKQPPRPPKHQTEQPWKGSFKNTRSFQKVRTPRKVGGS